MLAASEALQEGIRGYTQVNELASTMIQDLHSTHEMAIERVSTGIDAALGDNLQKVHKR